MPVIFTDKNGVKVYDDIWRCLKCGQRKDDAVNDKYVLIDNYYYTCVIDYKNKIVGPDITLDPLDNERYMARMGVSDISQYTLSEESDEWTNVMKFYSK